jgi:two-component sensor histidine kinase
VGREHAIVAMECKDRLEFALDATRTGIWSHNFAAATIELDRRTAALWGYEGPVTFPLADLMTSFHPEDEARFSSLISEPQDTIPDRDVEVRIKRVDNGAERWIAMRGRRVKSGADAETVGTARDVTDLKLHDAQVHLLMREVTHRSKNLLAIIQAMARQTVKDSLTAADFELRFSSRLRGLSFSHEILAAQDWRGASLSDLTVGHLDQVMDQHGHRIHISGPAVFIRPEAAQNIGLALNELTSNALKFGALSGDSGNVSIEWSIDADQSGPRWLHVVWNEYGGSKIEPPIRLGFGHRVMERVVARALDGIVNMTFAPTGLQWSLRIPVSHIASEAA